MQYSSLVTKAHHHFSTVYLAPPSLCVSLSSEEDSATVCVRRLRRFPRGAVFMARRHFINMYIHCSIASIRFYVVSGSYATLSFLEWIRTYSARDGAAGSLFRSDPSKKCVREPASSHVERVSAHKQPVPEACAVVHTNASFQSTALLSTSRRRRRGRPSSPPPSPSPPSSSPRAPLTAEAISPASSSRPA